MPREILGVSQSCHQPESRMLIAGLLATLVAVVAIGLRSDVIPIKDARAAACGAALRGCSLWTNSTEDLEPGSSLAKDQGKVISKGWSAADFPADVVTLTRRLVSIPSPTSTEQVVGSYIASWLRARGWVVVTPPVADGRFNVVAYPRALGSVRQARLVLSTHFDTVPAGTGRSRLERGRVYGRGAVDAKGILASMMVAAQAMIGKTPGLPLAMLFVSGEETDHAGMIAANNHGFSPSVAIINGEPTTGRICVSQKGILKVQLLATGTACHSGYPELGSSAIESLLDVIATLRSTAWKRDPETDAEVTMNVGLISGGTAANIVPAAASASISFRTVPSGEDVLEEVRSIVAAAENVTISSAFQNAPQVMYAPRHAAAKYGTYVAAYNTDLAYFKHASKMVLFGGGSIANAHVNDEFIELDDLTKMPKQYEAIALELLNEQPA